MNTADWKNKYERILRAMIVAEADPYQGPILRALYWAWWNHIMSVAICPCSLLCSDIHTHQDVEWHLS